MNNAAQLSIARPAQTMNKTIHLAFLGFLVCSCAPLRTYTLIAPSPPEPSSIFVELRAEPIDTLRVAIGATKSIPPHILYRNEAFVFRVTAELDPRQLLEISRNAFAIAGHLPDDVMNFQLLSWADGVELDSGTIRFQFLVKSARRGLATFMVATPWSDQHARRSEIIDQRGTTCTL